MADLPDIEKSDELVQQVREFAEKYLYHGLNQAVEQGEDPYTAIFALLECMQLIIPSPSRAAQP